MRRLYDPCTFHCNLKNVDLRLISSDTIYLMKNNSIRIDVTLVIDSNSDIVHITPNFTLEEFAEYKIVFSSALCFENGNNFPKSFCIRFRVNGGAAYSPNVIGSVGDLNYYSPKNQLRFSQIIYIYFDDSVDASENLTFEIIEKSKANIKPDEKLHLINRFKPERHNVTSTQSKPNIILILIGIAFFFYLAIITLSTIIFDILKLSIY